MSRRGMILTLGATALAASAAVASISMMIPPEPEPLPLPEIVPDCVEMPPYRRPASSVLVRMFRGRLLASPDEVEVTTIFPGPGFTVLSDVTLEVDPFDATDAEIEEITAHLRGIFSLGQVTSLGSSRVALRGGSAMVNEGPRVTGIRLEGHPVGLTAARLVVTETRDGAEVMATSVLARRGKTIVLAGASEDSGDDLLLVSLTPL